MAGNKKPKRKDTKLENEGAEFLVCGNLLIEGIATYKTYTQMKGYDLISIDPDHGTSAKIQVKSRWATDSDRGFLIKNFDTDFVVLALLNRAYHYSEKKKKTGVGKFPPEYFVLPVNVVKVAQSKNSSLGKVLSKNIPELEKYRDAWGLERHDN